MTDAATRADRVRRGAGWFERPDRALIVVAGADRVRWTNGMLSNDVNALAAGPERSGCHALLLTPQGRIAADLHVLVRGDALWLEVAADERPAVLERLDRYLIADDVTLGEPEEPMRHFALEGPRATEILSRAAGREVRVADDCCDDVTLGGVAATAAAWGTSNETAYQLIAPAERAQAMAGAILGAAGEVELVAGDAETLEVLRIESGTPRLGAELGLDVLPAETGLIGRAVSLSKGCYTGQEIVARMASRDAVAHRLVGIRFEDAGAVGAGGIEVGVSLLAEDGKRIGEVTSACHSARAGAIALGYVRRAQADPGTSVRAGRSRGRVVSLPFVPKSP